MCFCYALLRQDLGEMHTLLLLILVEDLMTAHMNSALSVSAAQRQRHFVLTSPAVLTLLPSFSPKLPVPPKEPKKEGGVILSLNLCLGTDCGGSCVEVNYIV